MIAIVKDNKDIAKTVLIKRIVEETRGLNYSAVKLIVDDMIDKRQVYVVRRKEREHKGPKRDHMLYIRRPEFEPQEPEETGVDEKW